MISSANSLYDLYYNPLFVLLLAWFISEISSFIRVILECAIWFRYFMNSLVSVEVLMPNVEDTSFSLFSVINAIILINDNSEQFLIGKDMQCLLSSSNY